MVSRSAMTNELEALLNPDLFRKEPIFTSPLSPPEKGENIYSLSSAELKEVRDLRGSVVDLHPGMGGVAPETLIDMINRGTPLRSLDYMLMRGCNFSCTWFFANAGPLEREYLPFSVLESITEEAAHLGVSLFILTGGEPLVYRGKELGHHQAVGDHFFESYR
jgi:sulfatase maturation enzyme AslB (radical SAM superfamily)